MWVVGLLIWGLSAVLAQGRERRLRHRLDVFARWADHLAGRYWRGEHGLLTWSPREDAMLGVLALVLVAFTAFEFGEGTVTQRSLHTGLIVVAAAAGGIGGCLGWRADLLARLLEAQGLFAILEHGRDGDPAIRTHPSAERRHGSRMVWSVLRVGIAVIYVGIALNIGAEQLSEATLFRGQTEMILAIEPDVLGVRLALVAVGLAG